MQEREAALADHALGLLGHHAQHALGPARLGAERAVGERVVGLLGEAAALEEQEQALVPRRGAQIQQQGARRVRDIRRVDATAGQFPQQPAIDGAEGEFAPRRAPSSARNAVEQPGEFRAAEVRIEQQTGGATKQRLEATGFELGAQVRGAPILPYDRPRERLPGAAIP